MASQLYKIIPEIKSYSGSDKELRQIIDELKRAIRLLKMEIERLQNEKQNI